MRYEVIKSFNSVNRRFSPGIGSGGSISDTDDVSPFTIADLIDRGFIATKPMLAPVTSSMALAPNNSKSIGEKTSAPDAPETK